MIFITVEDVINYHTQMINEFGGSHGIRDMGLLISAVEMPKATFVGQDLHASIFDKAAAYLFHIISNHPFIDGNKRTATATTITFLIANDIQLSYDSFDFEEFVVSVAQGKLKKEEISEFLKNCAH
ncbi:MAG TPA: type II toxin-antitoxin system death-on-curing family toxin [Gammaproteobacteria bacterium]|nr:type II toxin-antitoxin system death-on-curing family toxin [Gammaproteobacteria bacterium]